MEIEDPSKFPKKIKLYDDLDAENDNVIIIQESSNMQLGTGSRIWECGIVLSKYLIKQNLDRKIIIKNKKILELGGGTGYLSIVLGALGGKVICTDLKEILPLMKENIDNNKEIIKSNGGCVEIKELDWGNCPENLIKTLENDGEFDFIVASDVIFNKGHLQTFSSCLKNLMEIFKKTKESKLPEVFLCHKARSDEIDNEVAQKLEEVGFEGVQIPEEEMDKEYLNKRVDIFSLIFRGTEN